MERIKSRPLFLAALGVALLLGACSADSPTAPQPQTPVPPSTPPLGVSVTITADPSDQAVGSTSPSTITVRATREDGAVFSGTLTVTTDLGGFGSVGGPSTTQVQLVNGVGQAFYFPGSTAGVATLRVTALSSTSILATTRITIGQVVFFLSSVSPASGSAAGGEVVTINGGGFDGPVRVTFNGTPAEVLSVSPGAITVRTPPFAGDPGATGAPVTVSVTINLNEANAATDTLPSAFIYTSGGGGTRFLIASVTPTTGPNEGNTRVTITGDGFEAPVQVTFGDQNVNLEAAVESVTRTQIIVRTPAATGFGQALQNQSVRIRVKNLNSGLFAELANAFRYGSKVIITSMGPGVGPATGGTHVTLFGQGFDEPVAVALGGVAQFVLSVTGTEIVFVTSGVVVTSCPASGIAPNSPSTVSVTNIETGDGASANLGFNYTIPVLRLIGVNPNSGSVGSNTTITGQNFSTNVQVLFGGATGSVAQIVSGPTATSVTVKVPSPPAGFAFATEACDGNGDGIPGGTRAIATPISITVKNLDSAGCTETLNNVYTLNPPNTACLGDTSTPPPVTPQCSDGIDNDLDGLTDFNGGVSPPGDPQCGSDGDTNEGA
jgi:hypothetical protein